MKPMNTLNGYEVVDKEVRERITNLEAAVQDIKLGGAATATAGDILEGKTAWINGEKVDGTMPNHHNDDVQTTMLDAGEEVVLEPGYYDETTIFASTPLAEQTEGTATSANILYGKSAWVNGEKVDGLMPDNSVASSTVTEVPPGSSRTIENGYHNGLETLTVKSMEDLTKATAAVSDIRNGKTAWVNGVKLVGTLTNAGNGEGGGGVSVENGFTVNFYDAFNNLIQSEAAVYGYEIYSPVSHMVDHWEDENGRTIQFPLTFTEDSGVEELNVYESGPTTCERAIYNHCGVSKLEYPYLAVSVNGSYGIVEFVFSTSPGFVSVNTIQYNNSDSEYLRSNSSERIANGTSMSDVTKAILSSDPSLVSPTSTTLYSATYYYGNYNLSIISGRLDQTIYDDGSSTLIHPYALQEKVALENGEVTPDGGYYGLKKVIVNAKSGYDAIENGFTVNFFDKDKTFIESHSALYSMYIDKPLSYETDNWEHANGTVVTFPLTINAGSATSVYNLYAAGLKTCAQQLYAHFGIDIALYPVIVIGWVNDTTIAPTVTFAQSYTTEIRNNYRYIDLANCLCVNTVVYSGEEAHMFVREDVLKTVKYILNTYSVDDLIASELVSVMGGTSKTANYTSYIHTNDDSLFETSYSKCYTYDLDATTYEV